ncbi:phospholipase-like protein [Tanacetum coccineum]
MMMKLMTTIIEEVKTVNLELEDLLLTRARKGDQVAKAVYRYLGRTIPSTIYTRTLECPEGPANIKQTETHCQHGTWETVNLPSSDVSPMPSKPIAKTQAQSAKHGENLVGSRIKIWWRKDEIYYEGLVKSFDFISKRHKVDILEPVSHFLEAARENLSLKICRSLKITKLPTFTVPHCRILRWVREETE